MSLPFHTPLTLALCYLPDKKNGKPLVLATNYIKSLQLAKKINQLEELILQKISRNYPEDVFEGYFNKRNKIKNSKPYTKFLHEPNQIQQIKIFFNSLHLVKVAAERLEESTLLQSPSAASHLITASKELNEFAVKFSADFQDEIGDTKEYFGEIYQVLQLILEKSYENSKYEDFAFSLGKIGGHAINQMALNPSDSKDSSISRLTIALPLYIAECRRQIESLVPSISQHVPNANYSELEKLHHESEQLAAAFKSSAFPTDKGLLTPLTYPIYFLYTPINYLQRITRLIFRLNKIRLRLQEEVGALDESTQQLIIAILARIKYELLPSAFSFIDKCELQLLHEPLSFSCDLMKQVTSFYDLTVSISRSLVNYDNTAKKLLSLEDDAFIKERVAPLKQSISEFRLKKIQTEEATAEVNKHISFIRQCLEGYYSDTSTDYELLDTINKKLTNLAKTLSFLDEKNLKKLEAVPLPAWISLSWNASATLLQKKKQALDELVVSLQQKSANQDFKIKQRENVIQKIYDSAHITPEASLTLSNPLELDEEEVLSRRHLPNEAVTVNAGRVEHLTGLSSGELWDLEVEHFDKIEELKNIEKSITTLLEESSRASELGITQGDRAELLSYFTRLENYREDDVDTQQTEFPPYQLFINEEDPPFDENLLQITLRNGKRLSYNLSNKEPHNESPFYVMSLKQAQEKGHANVYVYVKEREELFYLDENANQTQQSSDSFTLHYGIQKKDDQKNQIAFKRNAIFVTLQDGNLICNVRNQSTNGCYVYTLELTEASNKKLRDCYVLDQQELYYITPEGRIEEVAANFKFNRPEQYKVATNAYYLDKPALHTYISHETKHTPVSVSTAVISKEELGYSLRNLNTDNLAKMRGKIYAELYRQGVIYTPKRKKVLNNLSRILAFSKNINWSGAQDYTGFEQTIIEHLLAHEKSNGSLEQLTHWLNELFQEKNESTKPTVGKFKLWLQKVLEQAQCAKAPLLDRYEQIQLERKKGIPNPRQRKVSLRENSALSGELSSLLESSETLKDKILESEKTLYKVNAVEMDDLTTDEKITLESLKIDHHYLMKHHQKLLEALPNKDQQLLRFSPKEYEKDAILRSLPYFKPELLKDDEQELKKGYLQLKKEGAILKYRCLYYGLPLEGEIALSMIKPALKKYDKATILNPRTYASILENIAKDRALQLQTNAEPRLDESVDLYFWYKEQEENLSKAYSLSQSLIEDIESCEKISECSEQQKKFFKRLKPALKPFVHSRHLKSFDCAFEFLKSDHGTLTKINERIAELKAKKERYKEKADNLLAEVGKQSLIPTESAQPTRRKTHLLKTTVLSEKIEQLCQALKAIKKGLGNSLQEPLNETSISGAVPYPDIYSAPKEKADSYLTYSKKLSSNVYHLLAQRATAPFPEVLTEEQVLEEPHQLLVYKRLTNLLYLARAGVSLLEQLDTEKINTWGEQTDYAAHLIKAGEYFYYSYCAYCDLTEDPNLNNLYHEILEKANDLYKHIGKKLTFFQPNKSEYQSSIPYFSDALIALNELPIRIRKEVRNTDESALEDAREEAEQQAKKTDSMLKRVSFFAGLGFKIHQGADLVNIDYNSVIVAPYNLAINVVDIILSVIVQLPIVLDFANVITLLNDLKNKLKELSKSANVRSEKELDDLRINYFEPVILKMDEIEARFSLKPGLLATPMRKALEQLNLGLITPTRSALQKRIELIKKEPSRGNDRAANATKRFKQAVNEKTEVKKQLAELETLKSLVDKKQERGNRVYEWFLQNEELRTSLQNSLKASRPILMESLIANDKLQCFPYAKHLLRGCTLHEKDEVSASDAGLKDTLLWFPIKPGKIKLVYIGNEPSQREHIVLDGKAEAKLKEALSSQHAKPKKLSPLQLRDIILASTTLEREEKRPFNITSEQLDYLSILQDCITRDEFSPELFNNLGQMSPIIDKCISHLKGKVKSAEIRKNYALEQREHLCAEKKNVGTHQQVLIKQVFEDYYDQTVKSLSFNKDNAKLFKVGYQSDLEAYLQEEKEHFFKLSTICRLLEDDSKVECLEKGIKNAITRKKMKFDREHLTSYQSLQNIKDTVNKFNKYIGKTEQEIIRHQALFETETTLKAKKKIIAKFDKLLTDDLSPKTRMENLRHYVDANQEYIVDTLTDHYQAEPLTLHRLQQLVCEFFYWLKGSAPAYQRYTDALENDCATIKLPSKPKNCWFSCSFFSPSPKRPTEEIQAPITVENAELEINPQSLPTSS